MAKKTPQQQAALGKRDEGDLLAHAATITFNRATIRVEGRGDDKRFVMEGPSGKHSLLVIATDLARLNAHWTVFATDPRNAISRAA